MRLESFFIQKPFLPEQAARHYWASVIKSTLDGFRSR
jgi:hypothetical protein